MNNHFTFLQKMRSAVGKFFFFLLLPLKLIQSNNVAMEHNRIYTQVSKQICINNYDTNNSGL